MVDCVNVAGGGWICGDFHSFRTDRLAVPFLWKNDVLVRKAKHESHFSM